jgi:hypothetical protein
MGLQQKYIPVCKYIQCPVSLYSVQLKLTQSEDNICSYLPHSILRTSLKNEIHTNAIAYTTLYLAEIMNGGGGGVERRRKMQVACPCCVYRTKNTRFIGSPFMLRHEIKTSKLQAELLRFPDSLHRPKC